GVPHASELEATAHTVTPRPFTAVNTEHRGTLADTKELSTTWQFVVMVTFMIAVLASHFLDSFMAGNHAGNIFADWSWRYLLFAAIVTVTSFPMAYDRARQSRGAPTLVQICAIFLTGMGWDKLLSTVHYVALR